MGNLVAQAVGFELAKAEECFRLASGLSHPGLNGNSREGALRFALNSVLPPRFEASADIVVNAAGASSGQIDVAVVDRLSYPPIHLGGVRIHPIESVHAVVQVKARVDSSADLASAWENLSSVTRLDPRTESPVHTSIVTQMSLTPEFLRTAWTELCSVYPPSHWPTVYVDTGGIAISTSGSREDPTWSLDLVDRPLMLLARSLLVSLRASGSVLAGYFDQLL